jgi:hypothetical protein
LAGETTDTHEQPAGDEKKERSYFWLWEAPKHIALAHLVGLTTMILVAVSLSDVRQSIFPETSWLQWLVFFAAIGAAGLLVELVVRRLLGKRGEN